MSASIGQSAELDPSEIGPCSTVAAANVVENAILANQKRPELG